MNAQHKCFANTSVRKCTRIAALLLLVSAHSALAQAPPFGSEGDLREQLQDQWWERNTYFSTMGGLSLIGPQWRAAGTVRLAMVSRQFTLRLRGTMRAGPLGAYGPDTDELYDILRVIDFIRYNSPRELPLHLRVGTINDMRLGVGHLVNYYSTTAAWDARTIGAEIHYGGRVLSVGAFTGDILLEGVSGGRLTVRPLAFTNAISSRTLRLGINYVIDRTPGGKLEGYSADLQLDLFSTGDVTFAPYVSYALYSNYGDGISFGADLYADDFLDVLSFRVSAGAFYSSLQFIPGYIGALYSVHNLHSRTRSSEGEGLAGITLDKSRGASDFATEIVFEVPPGFSLRYYYRRHFGGQDLDEYHLRIFVRSGQRLRFEVGTDKLGDAGFLGIFGSYGDLSALVFGANYRIFGSLRLSASVRYGFEQLEDENGPRYLVQRRFEPLLGIRIRL